MTFLRFYVMTLLKFCDMTFRRFDDMTFFGSYVTFMIVYGLTLLSSYVMTLNRFIYWVFHYKSFSRFLNKTMLLYDFTLNIRLYDLTLVRFYDHDLQETWWHKLV